MKMLELSRSQTYSKIACVFAIALAIFSGWREVGIDRNNYIEMYHGVISSDEWAIKFWHAKDVFFLITASVSAYLSDDPKLTFLVICIFSVLLKYFAARKFAYEYTLCFVILYALLLSPGLEFAAMRGGLAIGFLMLAVVYRDRRIKFFILSSLAVVAHISALLVVLLLIDKINKFLSKHSWGYVIIFLTIFFSTELLLELYPHGVDYKKNQATVLALAEPLATLCMAWLVFFQIDRVARSNLSDEMYFNISFSKQVVYGLIAIALGLMSDVVTASTRYLEVSWCLLLLVSIVMFRKTYLNMLGGLLLIAFLFYLNIMRFTWIEIINPTLGYS
jgi:EpsG family